ncbi:MAG: tetratricopeptide repeat protein, partial [Myxococcota bacterium]
DEPALTFDEDDDEPALTIEEDDDEPALSIQEDDDEPALSYEEDDDEPALTFEEDDEPEFSIEEGEDEGDAPDLGLGGDDDLADVLPPATGKTRAVTDEVAGDGGAATARRTVGRRKPRRENYAFVGSDVETLRQRVRLLRALGEGSSGTAAARSFLAAAEILERLGEVDEARTLFQLAHEADPKELIALRSLRRDAIARAEWDRAAEMLEAEAALDLSPSDRAHALSLLAEIQLHQLSDPAAAENAARGSMSARGSAGAGLLLLEACRTQNREAETFVALQDTASAWNDDRASAALLERAGRFAERAGKVERAREAFAAAAARHPSFSATLGAARTATSTRSTALTKIATTIQSPAIHEAFQRLAARFGSDEDALSLLEGAVRPTSLRLRAEASRRTEKAEVREQTLEALAAATGTTERALALIDLAEVRTARGALDEADEALRDAALADPGLDTVHVVREVLARRAGDKSRLARAVDAEVGSGGALQAAAKVVRGGDIAVERQWFGEAVTRGETPIAADILGLDAAAEAGDDEAVADALRRQADRATPDKRLGPLVELAAMRPEDRVELWREAIAEARPLVGLRALGRELSSDQPAEAAALLLEEADAMGRGNFQALVTAGRLLALAGDAEGARAAFERAMDDLPGASPASWALTDHLQRTGNIDALVAAFDRVLDQAKTPLEGANAAFRAAMISLDPESAGGFLRRARELLDGVDLLDPVLDSLLASASGVDASARASLLEARAKALPDQARTFRLRAAAAHEQAGDHPTAASIYRDALAATPDAMVEVSLDRAELAAGEHARVSSRRFDAVKDASTPEEKLVAMEALASLDLHERDETSSGILTLQSILTDAPGHLPTLRMLERLYMEGSRDDDLIGIERALLEHLPHADDVVAPTRLAIRLMLKRGETPGDAADPVVLITGRHFKDGGPAGDHWLARRVYAAALAQGDEALQLDTLRAIARELAVAPDEEASISAAIAELTAERDGPAAGAEVLRRHVDAHPDHPTLVEIYATLLRDAEAHEEAAAAFEQAAGNATVDPHRVELYYAAGRERERIEQIDAALANYEAASELDVTFADLFDRTQRLLETGGHTPRLAALVERRLQAGGDGPSMVGLHEVHARLAESMGDGAGARKALREALAIEPQRVTTLKKLAELSLKDEDWRGAAEALIRIARLRQDRDELRWVFFTLGDIYDRHMPDPKRAEAAFRRVLKLVPDDLEALDRLAQLFEREEMHDRAIDTLQQLAEREIDPDERKRHRLRLARVHELRGDPRSAEHVLEDTRRQIPTDLEVLRSIADLYQRQGAQSALSMHLNRAVADFRKVILEDPADELAWPGLVEILEWRQRRDPARVVAGAAIGVGVSDAELAARLSEGAVPAAGPAASDADLHDLLGPAALNRSVLEVFRLAGDAFDKALPFDTRQWRAEKIGRNDPARGEAQRIGQWFGAGDVQILVTSAVPRACIPVSRDPMTILVGNELLAMSTPAERAFLFASACKIASVNLSVAVRSQPADMYLLLAGLLRAYDPNHSPTGLEARALDDMAKRVFKAIPRRTRDTIGPLAFEMGGSPGFDAAKLGAAARQLGNNAALLALGSIHSALDALTKSGGGQPSASADARVNTLRQLPDAWALLTFALSDAHFEARRRAGCDRL